MMDRRVDICSPLEKKSFNWKYCFICQEENGDRLQNPCDNPVRSGSAENTYKHLAANILKLSGINQLPVRMNIEMLKKRDEFWENLHTHRAQFHKNCKKKFDDDKVTRAVKCVAETPPQEPVELFPTPSQPLAPKDYIETPVRKQPRRRSKNVPKVDQCFFCEGPAKEVKTLHKVTTFKLDARVRRAAKDTNNTEL